MSDFDIDLSQMNVISVCSVWIHRAQAFGDIVVQFNSLEEAYDFGIRFIKLNSTFRRDDLSEVPSTNMAQWVDENGIVWINSYIIDATLEDVMSSTSNEIDIASSPNVQITIYESDGLPPNHSVMYPDGIFRMTEERALYYGAYDSPASFVSTEPIVYREVLNFGISRYREV